MSNWDKRVQATFFIWLAFAVAVALTSSSSPVYRDVTAIIGIMAGAAFLSTVAIWFFGSEFLAGQSSPSEKAKRELGGSDVREKLLLELLTEGERQALKRRLIDDFGSDGEGVSLSELLADQEDKEQLYRT